MKSNEQILDEICASMADAWLAACERRFIGPACIDGVHSIVIDTQGNAIVFGPASAAECRLFVHRAAARDALVAIRPFAPAPLRV